MEEKFNKVKYNNEYNKNAYDRISLLVPKGKKDLMKSVASSQNLSLNSFIVKLIDEELKKY